MSTNQDSLPAPEQLFHLIVNAMSSGAHTVLDVDGRVVTWNEGAARITGWSASEIIGQQFSVFYPYEDIAARHPEAHLEQARVAGMFEEQGWRVGKGGKRIGPKRSLAP